MEGGSEEGGSEEGGREEVREVGKGGGQIKWTLWKN